MNNYSIKASCSYKKILQICVRSFVNSHPESLLFYKILLANLPVLTPTTACVPLCLVGQVISKR